MADPWIVSENSNLTHLETDGHLKGKAILIYSSNVYMDPLFSGNSILVFEDNKEGYLIQRNQNEYICPA